MDQFPFLQSGPSRSSEDLQAGFDGDANARLEVSLVGDGPADFRPNAGETHEAMRVSAGGGDLFWNPGIENDSWSVGQGGEDAPAAADDGFQEQEDRSPQRDVTALTNSATNQGRDVEFDDSERVLEAEADDVETTEDQEDNVVPMAKGEEDKREIPAQAAEQDWQDGTDEQAEETADIMGMERGDVQADLEEGYEYEESNMEPVSPDEEQEWNVRTKGRDEALGLNDNDDNVADFEEGLGPSNAAQISGDEDDPPENLGADKPGLSEEEKTGASDEANTGTSEEEKMGRAEIEKTGTSVKASQKRKSSASNGSGQVDTVVKKAKKKPVNVWAKTSSRKGSKKNTKNGVQTNPAKEDCVMLTPVYRNQDKIEDGPDDPILLSKINKAERIELSPDRLSAGSTKGYRMVRATRGVTDGSWYFEILVEKLGPTGHTRLGWSTQKGDVQAPVGFDSNSYAYRDVDGSKVHMAVRESYGELYVEGDVIGFYINLPHGAELAPKPPALYSYRGRPYIGEMKEEPPKIVTGSEIAFFRNGVCQGTAFKDINAGRYFPAASMYTVPNEPNCTVRFNFGPEFKFPPKDIGECPPPKAMCFAPSSGLDGQEGRSVAWGSESHAVNVTQTAELRKPGEARLMS